MKLKLKFNLRLAVGSWGLAVGHYVSVLLTLPVTLTLHRVRVRVNPNPGYLKWFVAYGRLWRSNVSDEY